MWESLRDNPLGRISVRKWLQFASALIVACFVYTFATAPVALAADATWKGSDIVYQNNSYIGPTSSTGNESHGLPDGTTFYSFIEPAGSGSGGATPKAHLIYFPSGVDPTKARTATYQTFDYPSQQNYKNPSAKTQISLAAAPAGGLSSAGGTTACVIEGIGWIVCPITNFLAKGMDIIYSWIDGFLEVRPLATTTNNAMYRAWGYMRNLANIAFVIAFMAIIYSQITSLGMSNYNVKRMLPRIIVAAILVNTSYWICAAAIDLFNILGYGLQDAFISIRNSLVGSEGNSWDVISWESTAAFILSGGSLAAGAGIATYLAITSVTAAAVGGGLIFLFLPLLLSVLFVVLVTFLILAARQAIITILVVIAPLAFVAYLLPNTEKWFEKWRSTFLTLLIVFPGFSLIFGGSQLAASIIIQNATSINTILLGMAVQVIPLAITPLLLKLGGGVLNRFAAVVNNPTKGVFDRGKTWARERSDLANARGLARIDSRIHHGRHTRGGRANPYRMTHNRAHTKHRIHEEKAAYESLSKAHFAQSADGQRIHGINQYAKLRQEHGTNTAEETWQNRVRTTPHLQNMATQSHHAHSAAQLHKASVDSVANEHWEHHLHGNAHLRAISQDTHAANKRAELYKGVVEAQNEQHAQMQIAGTPHLANLKVEAINAQGQADLAKAVVEAQGKLDLKNTVLNDRGLRQMVVQTNEFEKRAELADSILKARADAHWNHLANSDAGIRGQRLEQFSVNQSAKAAEEQWNSILADIGAKGSAAPGLSANVQVVGGSNTSEQRLADSIKRASQQLSIEALHKTSAEVVQKGNLLEVLKTNNQTATYAGGVDPNGRLKVVAKATTESGAQYMENVKAAGTILSNDGYTAQEYMDIIQQKTLRGGQAASSFEIHAAIQGIMGKVGSGVAAIKLTDYIAQEYAIQPTDTAAEAQDKRDTQQIFHDAFKSSGISPSFVGGTEESAMETGNFGLSSEALILKNLTNQKIKAESFAKMDFDEVVRMVQVLRDMPNPDSLANAARQSAIDTISYALNDPILSKSISDRNEGMLKVLQTYLAKRGDNSLAVDPTAIPANYDITTII